MSIPTIKPLIRSKPKEQLKEELARGSSLHKDEKRERGIRVRQWTYDKLGEFGSSRNDFDDVIFTLIDYENMRERKCSSIQPSAFNLSIATDAASAFVFIPSMFIAEAIDDMVLMTW